MQKIALIVVILVASLFSAAGHANSYDRGIKLYRRADFRGAEHAFLDVLRGGANRATKGRVYKYIGLSQYMLGRKKDARASFHSALKYDSKTEIYPNEALDSSVLEFFLQIKQDSKKGIGVIASPPPVSKSYPSHGKAITSKRNTPKAAPKSPSRRVTAAKVTPKHAAKKSTSKRESTAKSTKSGKQNTRGKRQVAKKKANKNNLFTGKAKKPPRVIFNEKGKTSKQQTRSGQLLLPPGADRGSHYYHEDSDLWRFLPFGVGQYMNDNYKLGHAFAAAGILTLGSFIFYMSRLREDQARLDDYYDERELHTPTAKGRMTPQKFAEYEAEWEATITEWEDYVGALKLYSYLSLAGFAAVWAGGVVEAMVNRPAAQNYSLLVPKVHYGYDHQGHQFALLWKYQLP